MGPFLQQTSHQILLLHSWASPHTQYESHEENGCISQLFFIIYKLLWLYNKLGRHLWNVFVPLQELKMTTAYGKRQRASQSHMSEFLVVACTCPPRHMYWKLNHYSNNDRNLQVWLDHEDWWQWVPWNGKFYIFSLFHLLFPSLSPSLSFSLSSIISSLSSLYFSPPSLLPCFLSYSLCFYSFPILLFSLRFYHEIALQEGFFF